MANISSNPWSFGSSDVVTSTVSNLVQDASNSQLVALTTTGAHGLVVGNFCTLISTNPSGFVGFYKVILQPTATTGTLQRIAGQRLAAGLTYVASGTVLKNQFAGNVRGEDMSWQNATAQGHEIQVYDRNGNSVWDTVSPTAGNYSRGKPFWIYGVSLAKIDSGTLYITVN